ncbi:MAG: HAMP domain-containing histidine kinase [Anaerolineaceae bacterium]|nr:HAMP domain-containing histidine kinase [Anaerolineaceae bacterium]
MDAKDTPHVAQHILGDSAPENIESIMLLVGHDLRSPVSIIVSALEVLISLYEDDPDMRSTIDVLDGALHAAYRELNLINDLLDLRRLELGSYQLEMEKTDLVTLLRDVLEKESYAITSKKLKVETSLPESSPMNVKVDTKLVKRMLTAMLDNALKFTTRDDTLRIIVQREGNEIVTRFEDTGRLIQSKFGDSILKHPPRWEERQAGTRTSVGMGMPFIYQAALAQGGSFSARSNAETLWTTFRLVFPAVDETA